MRIAHLAKRIYPHLPSGRAVYQLKMARLAAGVGLMLGGVLAPVIYLLSQTHR